MQQASKPARPSGHVHWNQAGVGWLGRWWCEPNTLAPQRSQYRHTCGHGRARPSRGGHSAAHRCSVLPNSDAARCLRYPPPCILFCCPGLNHPQRTRHSRPEPWPPARCARRVRQARPPSRPAAAASPHRRPPPPPAHPLAPAAPVARPWEPRPRAYLSCYLRPPGCAVSRSVPSAGPSCPPHHGDSQEFPTLQTMRCPTSERVGAPHLSLVTHCLGHPLGRVRPAAPALPAAVARLRRRKGGIVGLQLLQQDVQQGGAELQPGSRSDGPAAEGTGHALAASALYLCPPAD